MKKYVSTEADEIKLQLKVEHDKFQKAFEDDNINFK